MGFSEMLIVAAIALIVIGPKQLPELARMAGRMLNEWKRATGELKSTLTTDIREDMGPRKTSLDEDIAATSDHPVEPKKEPTEPQS